MTNLRTSTINPIASSDAFNFAGYSLNRKGIFGVKLVSITEEHRLQKRNLAAILGPVEVLKLTEVTNAIFGWDYANAVGNRIANAGGNPAAFTVEAPKGKRWHQGLEGALLDSVANPGKHYLRSYMSKATRTKYIYLVNGHVATPAEDSAIRQCLRVDANPFAKQHLAGVSTGNEVVVRDYTLDNIYGLFSNAFGVSYGMTFDNIVSLA